METHATTHDKTPQTSTPATQETEVTAAEPQGIHVPSLATPDPRVLRPSEVLHLQRTIGNAATARLVSRRSKPAVPTVAENLVNLRADVSAVQRLMTAEYLITHSDQRSVKGKKTLKMPSFGGKKDTGKGKEKKSLFKQVRDGLNEYHKNISTPIQTSRGPRATFYQGMVKGLTIMSADVAEYLGKHKSKNDRPDTVKVFEVLQLELRDATEAINGAAAWLEQETGQMGSTVTWLIVQEKLATGLTNTLAVQSRLGLPPAYADTLDSNITKQLLEADDLLATGKIPEAHKLFQELEKQMGGAFSLIKSMLLKRNMAQVDPILHNIVNTSNFEDSTTDEAVALQNYGKSPAYLFDLNMARYEAGLNATGSMMKQEAGKTADPTAHEANLKSTQQWEQKNVKLEKFGKLRQVEKFHLAEYGGNSDTYNDTMRNIRLDEDEFNPYAKGARHNKAGGLISALNRLPPLEGTFYRHDKLFDGFESMNQTGAVLTDLAFFSSSREVYTMVQTGHNIPEILTIIKGYTGRFTKAGVNLNNAYEDDKGKMKDENEVLFLPGTKFRVLDRYDATDRKTKSAGPYTFAHNVPPDILNVLSGDPHKKTIKIIVVKEEVKSS